MDHLRQGIHLRGYAAKNPKQEYKREAFELFSQMLVEIKHEVVRILSHVQVQQEEQIEEEERLRREELANQMQFEHRARMPILKRRMQRLSRLRQQPLLIQSPVMVARLAVTSLAHVVPVKSISSVTASWPNTSI